MQHEEITKQNLNKTEAKLITKSFVDEKRTAVFLVLEPQYEDYYTTDLHSDWYSEDVIEKACHDFNLLCNRAYIDHAYETQGFDFVESYIAPQDIQIGQTLVRKGSWLATIKVRDDPKHEWIWKSIKSGFFNGLSIQAMGVTVKI